MAERWSDISKGRPLGGVVRFLRFVIPPIILVLVLVRVVGIYGEYRSTRGVDGDAAVETTESAEATGAPLPEDGTEDVGEAGDEVDSSPTTWVIVEIPGLNLRAEPDITSGVLQTLPKGTRLELVSTEAGWHRVRSADGTLGWVSASSQYVSLEADE